MPALGDSVGRAEAARHGARTGSNDKRNMADTLQSTLSAAVIRLLRPLVRVVLRNGVSYQAFSELVKWVFVDIAKADFALPNRKVTKSRIAVITGLTRREVDRVVNMDEPREEALLNRRNRAARVLSGWAEDRDFRTASGPRDVPIDGDGLTFAELVRRYSGNQPTRAVLDELERVGAVERTDDDKLKLLKPYYEPAAGEREEAVIAIAGTAVADLLGTLDHNMLAEPGKLLFQGEVFERLDASQVEGVRRLLARKCDRFANDIDGLLTDQAQAASDESDTRMGLGLYVFVEPWREEEETEEDE